MPDVPTNPEQLRMDENRSGARSWQAWGPYLSNRQWGTVREDYSADGNAWNYFPFWHAHRRAYRWGEDGLAGVSDDGQRLCLALALWNGRDPILKERLYGLANEEGNHGEDVKELYYHLDATPSHSYLKFLYKYPQAAFPYQRLIDESKKRGRHDAEFEVIDTGVFDEDRYFDIEVEYAKATPTDLLMRITAHNRGPEPAELHVLPHVWFRNTWNWTAGAERPIVVWTAPGQVRVEHPDLPPYHFHLDGGPEFLFCENETNAPALFGSLADGGTFKDGINDRVVGGKVEAVNPVRAGTKAAGWYRLLVPAGGSVTVRGRLESQSLGVVAVGAGARGKRTHTIRAVPPLDHPFVDFDATFADREKEADEFYDALHGEALDPDARRVQRQAFAGLVWNKQYYELEVYRWRKGDPAQPAPPKHRAGNRNAEWGHLANADIVSMPDKWEYPYYCAWDLAFHTLPLALIDPEFAKNQLLLFLREWYLHPNGQLPAYEWNFSDVNPPVHAWAVWRVFQIDRKRRGVGDLDFLERAFHKLLLNFTWWVNRKDEGGRNIFQGGFLGLDNIGVFDRSKPLPNGGHINQADGTAWVAMYSLNLLRISLELSLRDPVYEDLATKFFEHFLHIAEAMADFGERGRGLWDEADQFYYDQLAGSDGTATPLRVRSMVGLIPMFAVETLEPELLSRLPDFSGRMEWFLNHRPDLNALVSRWQDPGSGDRRLMSLLRGSRLKKLLKRMLDETEFLSPYGVRSMSKAHLDKPYQFWVDGSPLTVAYNPGDSDTGMFGGNSNWRGPVWFPVNFLIIESLQKFHHYYGPDFLVEHPTGSGNMLTLEQIAADLSDRLCKIFLRGPDGHRPAVGANKKLQTDPRFRDHLVFPEYFHGDDGHGLGSSHQSGWTALVAKLLQPREPDPTFDSTGTEANRKQDQAG